MKTETKLRLYFYMSQVSLLVVMEIGLFPLICGWWLDICSLVRRSGRINSVDTIAHWCLMTNQIECNHDYAVYTNLI